MPAIEVPAAVKENDPHLFLTDIDKPTLFATCRYLHRQQMGRPLQFTFYPIGSEGQYNLVCDVDSLAERVRLRIAAVAFSDGFNIGRV